MILECQGTTIGNLLTWGVLNVHEKFPRVKSLDTYMKLKIAPHWPRRHEAQMHGGMTWLRVMVGNHYITWEWALACPGHFGIKVHLGQAGLLRRMRDWYNQFSRYWPSSSKAASSQAACNQSWPPEPSQRGRLALPSLPRTALHLAGSQSASDSCDVNHPVVHRAALLCCSWRSPL
jgi:hypothetical protein